MMSRPTIAIFDQRRTFSARWIERCRERSIPYKLVDCFQTDIVRQMNGCGGLMWHWPHWDHRARLMARQLTCALEAAGYLVFPSSSTSWHYDDKVGQKYLLEAIGAPLVPSYVFLDKDTALDWARNTTFPKVFKLRNGAGSSNVSLAKTKEQAEQFIDAAFGAGIPPIRRRQLFKENLWRARREPGLASLRYLVRAIGALFVETSVERHFPRERDYVYFQDFIPGNEFDIRVIVIGKRAFAIKRSVRPGEFRASGSGLVSHDPREIPEDCLKVAFEVAECLGSQCIAFDFVRCTDGRPLIVEVSYAFLQEVYEACPGYWDNGLNWHAGTVNPQAFIVDDFYAALCRVRDGKAGQV